jgi:hypothetical protein
MRAAIVALTTVVALVTSVMAQSRKVLVLPLEGDAPSEQRASLDASVVKLAREKIGGDITVGDTTFSETASAVGCVPDQPGCGETVRSMLGVDELVWGTAMTADGTTTVTVHRVSAGGEEQTQSAVITETDSGDQAESGIEALFVTAASTDTGPGSGSDAAGSGAGSADRPRGKSFFDTRERKLGVALLAGGTLALVVGLSLWSSAGGLQDDIDNAPRDTLAEINALKALEDRAGSRALWGNVFVVVGAAAAGFGGYYLWKDRENRRSATLAPAPVDTGTGMSFVLRGVW